MDNKEEMKDILRDEMWEEFSFEMKTGKEEVYKSLTNYMKC